MAKVIVFQDPTKEAAATKKGTKPSKLDLIGCTKI